MGRGYGGREIRYVLLAGHYPLVDHAAAAVHQWTRRSWSRYHGMLAYACIAVG
jgi:hypothetical protein